MRLLSTLLERVKEAAVLLGNKVEEGEAVDEQGNKLGVVAIYHGVHRVVVLDKKDYALFDYIMDFESEDASLLARQPQETQDRLFQILKLEMLRNRCGFYLKFDEKTDPKELKRIGVQQKVMVKDLEPHTLQRIADAVQELVVVAVRCQLLLGQVLREKPTDTGSSPHEVMYT